MQHAKRIAELGFLILTLAAIITGCGPGEAATPDPTAQIETAVAVVQALTAEAQPPPTASPSPSPAPTQTPTPIPTPTPTPEPPVALPPGSPYISTPPVGALFRFGRGTLRAMALSPDGERILVGGGLGVHLYRVDTLAEEWFVPTGAAITSVAWASDGERLATGSENGELVLRDAATGEPLHVLLEASSAVNQVNDLAFNPVGPVRLAASVGYFGGGVLLWSERSAAGWEQHTTADLPESGTHVAWSPNGTRLLAGLVNGTLVVINPLTGGLVDSYGIHRDRVGALAWSPDGSSIVTSSENGTYAVLDGATGEGLLAVEDAAGSYIDSISFSPDGTQAIYAYTDGDFTVGPFTREGLGSRVQYRQGPGGEVVGASFTPDGAQIVSASSGGPITVWDAATHESLREVTGYTAAVRSLAWSPRGDTLAIGLADSSLVQWNVWEEQEPIISPSHIGAVSGVAWSPNGEGLISVARGGSEMMYAPWVGAAQMVREPPANAVAWSRDGQMVAFARSDGEISVDAADIYGHPDAALWQRTAHTGSANDVDWSPDGRLASCGMEGRVLLWDGASGEPAGVFQHQDMIMSVAWSPDGSRLATGGVSGPITIWDTATGEIVMTLRVHTKSVNDLAWSPDGSRLASASFDGTVVVWNAVTGEPLRTLAGHTGSVEAVTWSPGGGMLASGASDGTVIVWDVPS